MDTKTEKASQSVEKRDPRKTEDKNENKKKIKIEKPADDAPENSWKYGNMDKYYQYRSNDPRVDYLKSEW